MPKLIFLQSSYIINLNTIGSVEHKFGILYIFKMDTPRACVSTF